MVCLPNTEPVIDDVAGIEFIARRAREVKATKVFCYAAVTKGLAGARADRDGPAGRDRRGRLHRRAARRRGRPGDAPRAVLRQGLRPAPGPASRGAEPRRQRRDELGRDVDAARPARHPRRRRGHHDRARPAPGRGDRRALPRRPRLDRGGDRRDPPRQGARPAGDLRHRPALLHPQRDGDRRLPHLRQDLAAAAQSRPTARRSSPGSPTAPSTRSPATTRPTTRIPSGCPSPRRRTASSGWRPCCRCRWRCTTTAGCR